MKRLLRSSEGGGGFVFLLLIRKKIPTRVKGKLLIDGTVASVWKWLRPEAIQICFLLVIIVCANNNNRLRELENERGFLIDQCYGKDSNMDDRVLLKEQLVYYYMQRALEGYPGITPFEGMASGVASLVRHLPAGRLATLYCISSIVEKANILCSRAMEEDADMWKNWQGDSQPCKKLVELLLRLLSLVDIQVLPNLMKLLAQFTLQLPKDGQNMVLDEIHTLVAEFDDVTRKPTLVSWVQSLSFLCSQTTSSTTARKFKRDDASVGSTDNLSLNRISARL